MSRYRQDRPPRDPRGADKRNNPKSQMLYDEPVRCSRASPVALDSEMSESVKNRELHAFDTDEHCAYSIR